MAEACTRVVACCAACWGRAAAGHSLVAVLLRRANASSACAACRSRLRGGDQRTLAGEVSPASSCRARADCSCAVACASATLNSRGSITASNSPV
ncbi:hypothetical protein M8494_33050 [Serratia ureilytica]